MTKIYNSSDASLNSRLATQVATVRGGMVEAAEAQSLPNRFDATPHPDHASMILTDIDTGRASIIPLFAYRAVREALSDLFG